MSTASPSGSGQRGPRSPTSTNVPLGRGQGDHTPLPRPTPPMPGQVNQRDAIPFPSRAPLGRAATATATAERGQPVEAIYFSDQDGNPLGWTQDGAGPVPNERACPYNFGTLTTGDLLIGNRGAWEILRICKRPAYARSARPRWDIILGTVSA